MKLNLVATSLFLSSVVMTPVMADEAPASAAPAGQTATSAPEAPQVKNFDCHYAGAKDSQDMQATITKDGDKYTWSDSVGESGPLTILPDRTITLDYSYVSKNQEKVSGKMTLKVKEDHTLEGTYTDSFDSGKISCVEHK